MKNFFNLGLIALLLVVLGCKCQQLQEFANQSKSAPGASPQNANSSNSPRAASKDRKLSLSLDKYNKIQNGMSYEEVVEIIGGEGTQTVSSGEGKYKVESYQWEGDDFQFLTVIFMGGKVNSKVQSNLE